MKKCNVCQAVLEDGVNFCTNCGSSSFSPIAEETPAVVPAPVYGPGPAEIPAPGANPYQMPVVPQKAPKKANTGLIIGLGAGGAAVLIAVIVLLCTVVLNPVRQFTKSLDEGNYLKAAEIFDERIEDDAKKYQKVYTVVQGRAEELLQQYRDEMISYDAVVSELYGIEMTEVLGYAIYDIFDEVETLNYCRETYAYAEESFNSGMYEDAIYYCRQIAGYDFEHTQDAESLLAEAMSCYRDAVISEARGYMEETWYDTAIILLQDALYVLPDDAAILNEITACMNAEHTYTMQMFIDEARAYADMGDYPGALACIDYYIAEYPEETVLQAERDQLVTAFETYVAEESLRLAKAGEFQHAVSLAESGLTYFTSARVTELVAVYKSHIPVLLSEMEMFQNDTEGGSWASKTDRINEYLEDNYSNKYKSSLTAGCGSITYLVNFKYQTLSGIVAFPKGLESDNARSSATLTIYGDGEQIAQFAGVHSGTAPEEFTLDISKYERVSLKWTCEGYNIWSDWGYFATIFDGQFIPIPIDLP